MAEILKPLIKWPGGKSSEIRQIEQFVPEYDRYVEPFVGGGALYFHLCPGKAMINDNSEYLMEFYTLAQQQDPEFREILEKYRAAFLALQEACEADYDRIYAVFRLYLVALGEKLDITGAGIHEGLCLEIAERLENPESRQNLKKSGKGRRKNAGNQALQGDGSEAAAENAGMGSGQPGLLDGLVFDREKFLRHICESVENKMRRTVMNHRAHPMSDQDLKDNLITGFTGGFYLYFRDVFNQIAAGLISATPAQRCANFFFVREYCYGSMFRYNAKGEFNIPYGGISYNKKDFSSKIGRIFATQTAALLSRTRLTCMDFEEMLDKADLTEQDFIFLDPPYDTEFSDYEGRDFTRKDHERLAACLGRTRAKFLLIIKNTDFIYSLYEGKYHMYAFENRYIYNVRSRNDRKAEHLIITNYEV